MPMIAFFLKFHDRGLVAISDGLLLPATRPYYVAHSGSIVENTFFELLATFLGHG
jgi:hypothetical protein